MNTPSLKLLLTFLLVIIYNVLFWSEEFGLNIFIFSTLLGGLALSMAEDKSFRYPVLISGIFTVLSAFSVVWLDSTFSKTIHIISFMTYIGFVQQKELRTIGYALFQTLADWILTPARVVGEYTHEPLQMKSAKRAKRVIRLVIIPFIICLVFLFLYQIANPLFDGMVSKIFTRMWEYIANIWERISILWLVFIGFGLFIISATLYRSGVMDFVKDELRYADNLVRRRKKKGTVQNRHLIGLKNENLTAMILIAAVNVLLFIVNMIDINWLWFGFEIPEDFSLKQFVHEGTYMLILSILLSMGILFYFFRGNQNFYSRSRGLRWLSYLWIVQNLILGISVCLRNYYYIDHHGLAYKRIGVIIFLLLTLAGLVTMFIKIKWVKSAFYLIRVNSWIAYSMLIALCFVNWDVSIVNYNLQHDNPNEIDIDAYLTYSPKVIPILYDNMDLIEEQMRQHRQNKQIWVTQLDPDRFLAQLNLKRKAYLENQQELHWPSWTLADYHTLKAIQQPMKYDLEEVTKLTETNTTP